MECALNEWTVSAGLLGCCCPCCLVNQIVDRLEENCCYGASAMGAMRTKLRLIIGIRVSLFLSQGHPLLESGPFISRMRGVRNANHCYNGDISECNNLEWEHPIKIASE